MMDRFYPKVTYFFLGNACGNNPPRTVYRAVHEDEAGAPGIAVLTNLPQEVDGYEIAALLSAAYADGRNHQQVLIRKVLGIENSAD